MQYEASKGQLDTFNICWQQKLRYTDIWVEFICADFSTYTVVCSFAGYLITQQYHISSNSSQQVQLPLHQASHMAFGWQLWQARQQIKLLDYC
jgi:hypothetical protein